MYGPPPAIAVHPDEEAETRAVSTWLAARAEEGESPETTGVFVRSETELPRAVRAVERAGLEAGRLDEKASVPWGAASPGTSLTRTGSTTEAVGIDRREPHVGATLGRAPPSGGGAYVDIGAISGIHLTLNLTNTTPSSVFGGEIVVGPNATLNWS